MEVIIARDLNKKYKDKTALDNFNISITENKIIGLIGRNGAGKTTFLKTCAGRIKQSSGEINIFGEKVFDNINILSKIVFVDEDSQYDSSYKVKEILKLAECYYESWDRDLASKLLKHFNLNPDKKYKKLSRGMKTQVNTIIGICCNMPLTILDEPTLGLDAGVRKDFYNILINDYMKNPRTIVISSHLLNEIDMLLEDIILIDDGKLILNMSMEDFRRYSVELSGDSEFLSQYTKGKEVINESVFGNSSNIVIKNDLTDKEIKMLKNANVDIKSVSPQDLFIHMTSKGVLFDDF